MLVGPRKGSYQVSRSRLWIQGDFVGTQARVSAREPKHLQMLENSSICEYSGIQTPLDGWESKHLWILWSHPADAREPKHVWILGNTSTHRNPPYAGWGVIFLHRLPQRAPTSIPSVGTLVPIVVPNPQPQVRRRICNSQTVIKISLFTYYYFYLFIFVSLAEITVIITITIRIRI